MKDTRIDTIMEPKAIPNLSVLQTDKKLGIATTSSTYGAYVDDRFGLFTSTKENMTPLTNHIYYIICHTRTKDINS